MKRGEKMKDGRESAREKGMTEQESERKFLSIPGHHYYISFLLPPNIVAYNNTFIIS